MTGMKRLIEAFRELGRALAELARAIVRAIDAWWRQVESQSGTMAALRDWGHVLYSEWAEPNDATTGVTTWTR